MHGTFTEKTFHSAYTWIVSIFTYGNYVVQCMPFTRHVCTSYVNLYMKEPRNVYYVCAKGFKHIMFSYFIFFSFVVRHLQQEKVIYVNRLYWFCCGKVFPLEGINICSALYDCIQNVILTVNIKYYFM